MTNNSSKKIYSLAILLIFLFGIVLISAYILTNKNLKEKQNIQETSALQEINSLNIQEIEPETQDNIILLSNTNKGNNAGSSSSSGRNSGGSNNRRSSSSSSSSFSNGIGSMDSQCNSFGFDFGVAKWECNDDWIMDEELVIGTSVTGNCDDAFWNVEGSGADGVVIKAGNINHGGYYYSETGLSGILNLDKDISHITFCGYYGPEDCGNQEIDTGEECDEGVNNGQVCSPEYDGTCTYCSNSCENKTLTSFCGDNILDEEEECDDGNNEDGDGCNALCMNEFCGDEIINNINETCDLGEGNGILCIPSYGESCTYCADTCENKTIYDGFCGDNILDEEEECEINSDCNDEDEYTEDTCNACSCEYEDIPECGNEIEEEGEECDDGNLIDNDGCSSTCELEVCEHDVGIRFSYEDSFGTGIAIKPSATDDWIDDPVNLILHQNYIIKYFIDNKIINTINNIRVIVKINQGGIIGYKKIGDDGGRGRGRGGVGEQGVIPIYGNETIIADYNTSIDQYHMNEVDFNVTGLQGIYNISVFVEKINETDCDLIDNYAEREITITLPEPECGNNITEQDEQCDDGNLINEDGCSENCMWETNCDEDLDCGENQCAGGPNYCIDNNIFQDFIIYTCVNPGQQGSYCTNQTLPWLLQECVFDCNDGFCSEPNPPE